MKHIIAFYFNLGISSPYARHAAGVKMNVASPDSVFLFNYRGTTEDLDKIVFMVASLGMEPELSKTL